MRLRDQTDFLCGGVLSRFREVSLIDTEFESAPGERSVPVCVVVRELRSGRTYRIFEGEFPERPPFATGPDVLFVAFYASAECGVFRALGWPMPERILDLFCEFRDYCNGLPTPSGSGELGALVYFGLDHMDAIEKKAMQVAIGSGAWRGRYTPEQIMDYCERDVRALEQLLPVMLPKIDLPRALLRGRYMVAAAAMEWNGTPIDTHTLARLREGWTGIQDRLITAIDADYHIYEGRSFRADRFADWLTRRAIPWPLLESGRLNLSDDTFKQMAKAYPVISPLRELRSSLSDLRLNDLAVGRDGRNRTMLSAFRARTARNQPSNTKFIFGPSVWLRGLIKPPPDHGVAYIDWSQQEFGIAAYLSGDPNMIAAYQSGDCYLAFGKQAGIIPPDGTKHTHKFQRELCKQCILGVQYGMGAYSLALGIGQPEIVARDLLCLHRETYAVFWRWSDAAVDTAMSTNSLHTAFGWHIHVGEDPNPRSLRNFLMQGNGAGMLQISCCLGIERGVEIGAPIHDAVLICAPLNRLDADIATMRQAMAEASRAVLGGPEIGTDVSITRFPDRFMDDRGEVMWNRVMDLLPPESGQLRVTA